MIGPINLDMKQTGERSAGNRPAAFDVAGAGNVTMVAGLRAIAKAVESPPAPTGARASSRPYLRGRWRSNALLLSDAVHGVDDTGKVTLIKPRVPCDRLATLIAQLTACLIGMDACSGAH